MLRNVLDAKKNEKKTVFKVHLIFKIVNKDKKKPTFFIFLNIVFGNYKAIKPLFSNE